MAGTAGTPENAGQGGSSGTAAQGGSTGGGARPGGSGGPTGGAATREARGAVSLHVAAGDDCSLSDTWVDFPALTTGHPVTGAARESLLQNRTHDENGWTVQVGCEWLSEEEPYFVSLAIGLIGEADQRLISMLPLLSIGSQQDGTMTFLHSESTPRFAGNPACQFEALSLDVQGGTVWGRFACASVVDDDTGEECAVSEAYFYFENCTPKEI